MLEDITEDDHRYQEEWQERDTEDLIQALIADPDGSTEEGLFTPLYVLHQRGTQAMFDRTKALCLSDDPRERRAGANIIGQLGSPDEANFHDAAVQILLAMIAHDEEPEVLGAIAVALGHRNDPRAIMPLVRFKNHPTARVREGVAFGLTGFGDERAIAALIELSGDVNHDVRDWATTGLGALLEIASPAINSALFARLEDTNEVVRGEALVGLARRHDERVLATILSDLAAGVWSTLIFEAAEELGDPRLYPVLLHLQADWNEEEEWPNTALAAALASCRPQA